MDLRELEPNIVERGRGFFRQIEAEKPSLFNKGRWTGAVMDWSMRNEKFKTQLFRFVDVFPALNTPESLSRHIQEYFGGENKDVPAVLRFGAGASGAAGSLGMKVLNKLIRRNIEEMARQFIIGQTTPEAVRNLQKLRKQGFSFVVDVLGEAAINEEETGGYIGTYLELLDALREAEKDWKPLGADGKGLDYGYSPLSHISIKPSAFYSQAKPVDFEHSVRCIVQRMVPVYRKAVENGALIAVDMESHTYKAMTIEAFKRLRSSEEFRGYPHVCLVLQAYLRETDTDVDDLVAWARRENLPISVRLVKGAYWDYESIRARQNSWEPKVWTRKPESDAAFERNALKLLQAHEHVFFACASHNVRSICAVLEAAEKLKVPEDRYEFQVLYGMAEPVRKALLRTTGRVRLYCPYGEMVPGMAYLVRRLLENTANESFLRQSFVDEKDIARLMEDPRKTIERQREREKPTPKPTKAFANEAAADFTDAEQRKAIPAEIEKIRRERLGRLYKLYIAGEEIETEATMGSRNPAKPSEIVGRFCLAEPEHCDLAVGAAARAFPAWRDFEPRARADLLRRAADVARSRIWELCAWQVLDVGKQFDQAHADVTEAIDFMTYYAMETERLAKPQRLGDLPGEVNLLAYEPRGVCLVVAPWNFPLAIPLGMCAAAIVTGNTVVFKPSERSTVIAHHVVELFKEAGLPDGVLNFLPGEGSAIGDKLVEHPGVSSIVFTGSMATGLRIVEKAALVQPGQAHVKRVITEMGGKNAVIVDDDADLDEAVPAVLYSAFGFQGQKCSACSRVIVLDSVYDRFIERLLNTARSKKTGNPENPANHMGPMVDERARDSVLKYQEIAREEGTVLFEGELPDGGYYAPMMIVGDISPGHRVAQEEVFGPLLAVMRAKSFDEALEIAMSTRFALTGGVFSRSPVNLDKARERFRVGNLYLNKPCTGAMVGRQAFGGSRMSGVGSKTGGPDYLQQFMEPRVVTENTMRRGFAPMEEGPE